MHVGLYSPSWPLQGAANGIVTYVHWLRHGLVNLGHRVTVFTGHHPEGRALEADVRIVPSGSRSVFDRLFRLGGDVFGSGMGRNLLAHVLALHRKDPLDVFEMEESFGWFDQITRQRDFGVVVKLHGPAFQTLVGRDRHGEWAERKIRAEGLALANAAAIIAPSRAALDGTLQFYGLKPPVSAHIVNPLALDGDIALWRREECDPDTALFVGRFDLVKGGDRVLQIFKRVLARRPASRLIFVGPDYGVPDQGGRMVPFAEYAARLFTPAELQHVDYRGRQPPEVIATLRRKATVNLVASRWETQGYTALEAMLQGSPVVCADTSGLSEAVSHGRNGLLFDGDDIEAGASHLLALMADLDLAARLGTQARIDVSAAHDPCRVAEQTLAVYRSVLDRVRRPPR